MAMVANAARPPIFPCMVDLPGGVGWWGGGGGGGGGGDPAANLRKPHQLCVQS